MTRLDLFDAVGVPWQVFLNLCCEAVDEHSDHGRVRAVEGPVSVYIFGLSHVIKLSEKINHGVSIHHGHELGNHLNLVLNKIWVLSQLLSQEQRHLALIELKEQVVIVEQFESYQKV